MNDAYREFSKRQHRILGHYLAVQAWVRGLDCIVLERRDLETFLDLKRFKRVRMRWLQADVHPWFPHQQPYYTSRPSSVHSLFLSRVPIRKHLPSGSMTTTNRIREMAADSPRTDLLTPQGGRGHIPLEAKMVSTLSVLAAGLDVPLRTRRVIKRLA